MDNSAILAELDKEIARLQAARRLLSGVGTPNQGDGKRGRQRSSKLSAEAHARIADAQRRRWAKQRKSA